MDGIDCSVCLTDGSCLEKTDNNFIGKYENSTQLMLKKFVQDFNPNNLNLSLMK